MSGPEWPSVETWAADALRFLAQSYDAPDPDESDSGPLSIRGEALQRALDEATEADAWLDEAREFAEAERDDA